MEGLGYFLMRYHVTVFPSLPLHLLADQPTFVFVRPTKPGGFLPHLYTPGERGIIWLRF